MKSQDCSTLLCRACSLVAATVAGFVLLWAGPALGAGTGYATSPAATAPPGGFTSVVVSQSVPPSGGTVTTTYNGSKLTITVPSGSFTATVQVTVTAATVGQIAGAVVGFDVTFTLNGQSVSGTFAHPVTFTITNNDIKAGDVVNVWNGSAWVGYPNASVTNGSAKIVVTSDPAFVVQAASTSAAPTAVVPGATTATTGFPLLTLVAAAGGFVLIGLSGLLAVRRRKNALRRL